MLSSRTVRKLEIAKYASNVAKADPETFRVSIEVLIHGNDLFIGPNVALGVVEPREDVRRPSDTVNSMGPSLSLRAFSSALIASRRSCAWSSFSRWRSDERRGEMVNSSSLRSRCNIAVDCPLVYQGQQPDQQVQENTHPASWRLPCHCPPDLPPPLLVCAPLLGSLYPAHSQDLYRYIYRNLLHLSILLACHLILDALSSKKVKDEYVRYYSFFLSPTLHLTRRRWRDAVSYAITENGGSRLVCSMLCCCAEEASSVRSILVIINAGCKS